MKRLLTTLLILLVAAGAFAGQSFEITLLHTNDLHGMMLPFSYAADKDYADVSMGGLARRATMISEIRQSAAHPVLTVDCGDTFTRGPWHLKFFGEPEIEALNAMNYDALCIGNNEFKAFLGTESQAVMLKLLRLSRFPWLAANVTVGNTGQPVEGVHPFVVRRFGDVKVGLLGLTAPRAKDYPQTAGWTISDPVEAAKKWVPIARRECDVLIALTHIGDSLDMKLAAKVAGIDAIVGGDSHTFIPQAVMVKNPNGRLVPIVQAGEQGVVLGQLDLTFEKTNAWGLTKSQSKLIPVNRTVKEDRAMKSLLNQWLAPAKKEPSAPKVPATAH
jgi:5'-nucleotidase